MNPYRSYAQLLFTCVDCLPAEVAATMARVLNEPKPSLIEQSFGGCNPCTSVRVFENGMPKIYKRGDPMPPRAKTCDYFVMEVPMDISLAYVDRGETNYTKTLKVLFWEPRIHPGRTVFMGNFHDGLTLKVFRLSETSRNTWINVRITDDDVYPARFFDYYADHRKVSRRLMACKDELGWDAVQKGPLQPFENPSYYTRRLKKDTLTRDIITEYMKKLGYHISDDGFWETDKTALFLWQERRAKAEEFPAPAWDCRTQQYRE